MLMIPAGNAFAAEKICVAKMTSGVKGGNYAYRTKCDGQEVSGSVGFFGSRERALSEFKQDLTAKGFRLLSTHFDARYVTFSRESLAEMKLREVCVGLASDEAALDVVKVDCANGFEVKSQRKNFTMNDYTKRYGGAVLSHTPGQRGEYDQYLIVNRQ